MIWTVGKKMYAGFIILLLLAIAVGLTSFSRMNALNHKTDEITGVWLPGVESINKINSQLQRMLVVTMNHVVAATAEAKAEQEKTLAALAQSVVQEMQRYESTIVEAEDRANFDQLKKSYDQLTKLHEATLAVSRKSPVEQSFPLYQAEQKQLLDMAPLIDKMIAFNHNGAVEASDESDSLYSSALAVMTILLAAALVVGLGTAFFLTRSITKPLIAVTDTVQKVARGDLTVDALTVAQRDEIGTLARSTNDMMSSLTDMIGSVLKSSQSVAATAEQISGSTEDIANGATNQASAAQTVNELFRELSRAIDSVARNAESAAELSSQARAVAKEGGTTIHASIEAIRQLEGKMGKLQNDSDKIGQIISVIDDIADQTNLLALNAAIEAARAGEQGKGFAVVADEVRKLAERSGDATKEIAAIIKGMQANTTESVTAVSAAVELSRQIDTAFSHIVDKVNETAEQVGEIAAASEEQAAQSAEVLQSVETIAAASEQSAAASQETAAASQSLARLSENLNATVASFKIR
ncbi:methyl-accepting chemotaxis protein [Paenibacillus flagellatus]|uniref:Methyl-accepting chemotaxis protein n=1 Tax=Paenibacillus flagellatus TaxID=2211139 RepID=A0A2V5KQ46_9BACL|nr:methyl-accepting chemotaxis protein [Paenibacillus flagellatus]PYI50726.1 methyl-accepting chemotaxis protein [Paenibacillus flagellatus]